MNNGIINLRHKVYERCTTKGVKKVTQYSVRVEGYNTVVVYIDVIKPMLSKYTTLRVTTREGKTVHETNSIKGDVPKSLVENFPRFVLTSRGIELRIFYDASVSVVVVARDTAIPYHDSIIVSNIRNTSINAFTIDRSLNNKDELLGMSEYTNSPEMNIIIPEISLVNGVVRINFKYNDKFITLGTFHNHKNTSELMLDDSIHSLIENHMITFNHNVLDMIVHNALSVVIQDINCNLLIVHIGLFNCSKPMSYKFAIRVNNKKGDK